MRLQALIALALGVGACGDDLAHPASFPTIVDHGGKHAGRLNLVTMTYPDDTLAHTGIDLDSWILGSQWLQTVGADYGVTGGAHLGAYVVGHSAAAAMTAADVVADLDATVPAHDDADGELTVDVVYLPRTTRLTFTEDGTSFVLCTPQAWAFHDVADHVFAIVADCDGTAASRTALASHEIIEAATDPDLDGFYADGGMDDGWHYDQEEVADLCQYAQPRVVENGFSLERIWSTSAAQGIDLEPCVPVPDGASWEWMDADPTYVKVSMATPGVITLHGWSTTPDDKWHITGAVYGAAASELTFKFDTLEMTAGGTATLTVSLPGPDLVKKGTAMVQLYSGASSYIPIEVDVP